MSEEVFTREAAAEEQQKRDEEFAQPYPVKLLSSEQEKRDDGRVVWVLRMERQDEVWEDTGDPVVRTRFMTLRTAKGRMFWPGSDTDQVAASFEGQTGCQAMPGHDGTAGLINHYFMVKDVPQGPARPGQRRFWTTVCEQYLGEDYKFDGTVKKREARNAEESDAQEEAAAAKAEEASKDDALKIAEALNGLTIAEIKSEGRDKIKELGIETLGGKSLRGLLARPDGLVSTLSDLGVAEMEDEVLVLS